MVAERSETRRVNEIDALRFVAALAVVAFHYAFRGHAADDMTVVDYPLLAPLAPYGYLGVELFFMISGFVILMSAGQGDARAFVISRTVRLFPAFWACATLTFVVELLWGGPRYAPGVGQYLANLTMFNTFVGIESLDGAYWSLAVEMHFYLLVLALLLARRMAQVEGYMIGWLALSATAGWWGQLPGLWRLQEWLVTDFAPYFIAGALFFRIHNRGATGRRWALLAACLAVALPQEFGRAAAAEQHYHTALNRAAVAGLVLSCFGVMALVALRRTGAFGRRRWSTVGALTYPLYLLHQHIGYIAFNQLHGRVDPHLLFWGTVLLMLVLAWLVNRQVEQRCARPFKAWLQRRFPPRLPPQLPPLSSSA